MRTTIRLDDALLRRAKAQAAASGRSLNDFIADAVRAALAPRPVKPESLGLPTFRGRGIQPGVDLDDASALLDRMEGPSGQTERTRSARVAERPKQRRR